MKYFSFFISINQSPFNQERHVRARNSYQLQICLTHSRAVGGGRCSNYNRGSQPIFGPRNVSSLGNNLQPPPRGQMSAQIAPCPEPQSCWTSYPSVFCLHITSASFVPHPRSWHQIVGKPKLYKQRHNQLIIIHSTFLYKQDPVSCLITMEVWVTCCARRRTFPAKTLTGMTALTFPSNP